jgi:hypothetical protein
MFGYHGGERSAPEVYK